MSKPILLLEMTISSLVLIHVVVTNFWQQKKNEILIRKRISWNLGKFLGTNVLDK